MGHGFRASTQPTITQWRKPVDLIESWTNLDFLSSLSDDVERRIEANANFQVYTPTSPLLAEAALPQSVLFLELPIGHDSTVDNNASLFTMREVEKINPLQSSLSEINIVNRSLEHFRSRQSGTSQISIGQISPGQVSGFQDSSFKNGALEFSISQISPVESSLSQPGTNQISPHQIGVTQVAPPQISTDQISITQVNSAKISSAQIDFSQGNSTEISLSSSITLQQLLSSHNPNLQNTTVPIWLEFFQGPSPSNLNIEIADLPTGQLAEATITGFDPTGRPNSGTLYLDTDANGLGWYIDPTPWDNIEYSQTLTATADSLAYGHYDLLTTLLHETAHLQGFISGYSNYDRYIQNINGSKTFVDDGFSAILTPDGSHLSSQVYPYDLMNTTLTPGVRKLPSTLDIQILKTVRTSSTSIGNSATVAALTSGALIAINNGRFDTATDWYTRDDSQILNGQAVLSEDSPYLSHLSQTFVIPQGAKSLQFTSRFSVHQRRTRFLHHERYDG